MPESFPFFFLAGLFSFIVNFSGYGHHSIQDQPYRSPSINHKTGSVLSLMTLEEKASQLSLFGTGKENIEELIKEGKVGGINGMLPFKKDVRGYMKKMQKIAMQSPLWREVAVSC